MNAPINPNIKLTQDLAKAGAPMTKLGFDDKAAKWFTENFKRLKNLAGDEESARKIFLMALNTATRNPALLDCDFNSFASCILTSCELKLYPGAMQECAYVPFKGQAQFMPMYQGLVKLAYNSGFVRDISAAVVYERDEFSYELGTNQHLSHKPFLGEYKDRGNRVCVYGIIKTLYGSHIVVKSMDFIYGIKARSKGADSKFSPWNGTEDDFDAMACKTVFKQGAKYIPKSVELQSAIDWDNAAESVEVIQSKKPELIDVTAVMKAVKAETKELENNKVDEANV